MTSHLEMFCIVDIESKRIIYAPGVKTYSQFPIGFVYKDQVMAPIHGFIYI